MFLNCSMSYSFEREFILGFQDSGAQIVVHLGAYRSPNLVSRRTPLAAISGSHPKLGPPKPADFSQARP